MRRMFAAAMAVVGLLVLMVAPAHAAPERGAPRPDDDGSNWQIVGGGPAPAGAYPWMAAILADFDGSGGLSQFCGGSLIAPDWVLTAAHCFYDDRTGGSSLDPAQVQVVIGANDWTLDGELIAIDAIVIHPGYEPLRTVNDITLLHLAAVSAATPIPIASEIDAVNYEVGDAVRVIGYGATRPNGTEPSATLLQVDVPVVSDDSCATGYDIDFPRHLCAGAPGPSEDAPGPDSCQGDSGGPLFTPPGGPHVQVGIVSFGGLCGVERPGVYTELVQYRNWVAGILDGSIAPGAPDPDNPDPNDGGAGGEYIRIDAGLGVTEPVTQAVETSFRVFEDQAATFGVLATGLNYPDALGGSALAFGVAPLLFADANGLPAETAVEFERVVQPGSPIFILGGTSAVPAQVDDDLRALGFVPERLAGIGRHETAALVADAVANFIFDGAPPLDTMIVATAGNWPDAVTAGQISSWFGIPILLTDATSLNQATAEALTFYEPSRVFVMGGTAAVSDPVGMQIAAITGGDVFRVGGASRFGTAAAAVDVAVQLYQETEGILPETAVAVNLRRADAFAHVLSASMVTGSARGIFVALEDENGSTLHPEMAPSICGSNLPLIVQGAEDLVSTAGASAVQQSLMACG